MLISSLIMAVLLAADQLSKMVVHHMIEPRQIIPFIPNMIELTFVRNKGVSFSFLADLPDAFRLPLLIGVSSVAVVGMLYYLFRYWDQTDIYLKGGFVLIIPGAFGNLIDRVAYGAVTDFMHFHWYDQSFFVNNVADCFISIGVIGFLLSYLAEHRKRKAQATEPQ